MSDLDYLHADTDNTTSETRDVRHQGLMEPRIIKTDDQHRRYLAEVEKLAAQDPEPESAQGTHLELLAKLVEEYEKTRYVFDRPDPIDAIVFRMDQ